MTQRHEVSRFCGEMAPADLLCAGLPQTSKSWKRTVREAQESNACNDTYSQIPPGKAQQGLLVPRAVYDNVCLTTTKKNASFSCEHFVLGAQTRALTHLPHLCVCGSPSRRVAPAALGRPASAARALQRTALLWRYNGWREIHSIHFKNINATYNKIERIFF